MYELYITRRAEKFLNHTDPPDRDRIRVGPYRVIYLIDDASRTVDIGKVDRRKERTYKDLRTLFR